MKQVELSAGTIEYHDTGGDGPAVVLLHGFLMDASLWDEVISDLATDHRCVAPNMPLGAHRIPVSVDADLSLHGMARLIAEFLDRLDLREVTLVGNDTGGAIAQITIVGGTERVRRVVLASCEAFDNIPPGLTGKTLALAGRLSPRIFGVFMQQMRFRALRRLPIAFGWLTIRGDATTARWIKPLLTQPLICRDAVRAVRAVMADRDIMVVAARRLREFDRPALVVWAKHDRVMPLDHGRRIAEILPQGVLAEVQDSYTLIPLDQPMELAHLIRDFIRQTL